MCEIILLFVLGKKIAAMAGEKGRVGWPWVLMLVVLWLGGEITGAVVGAILTEGVNPAAGQNAAGPNDNMLPILGCALAGAICGAVITFVTVSLLPPAEENYDDYDDRPRRRRRRSDDEDGDYDRPRRRRYEDDDEYDDQGFRVRRRRDDD